MNSILGTRRDPTAPWEESMKVAHTEIGRRRIGRVRAKSANERLEGKRLQRRNIKLQMSWPILKKRLQAKMREEEDSYYAARNKTPEPTIWFGRRLSKDQA